MDEGSRKIAVQWFVKLSSTDVSSADHHRHREWLQANQEHQSAYDEVCEQWADLDGIDSWARGELGQLNLARNASVRHQATRWALGLGTAAVLLLGFTFWPTFSDPSEYYQTVKSEQRLVTLTDGSLLHLNTASAAAVRFESELREVVLSKGEGVFDVEHDSRRPFIVRAGNSSIIALGTRFSVQHRGVDEVEVTVLEGRVAIVPSQGTTSKVLANQTGNIIEAVTSMPKSLILGPDQQVVVGTRGLNEQILEVNAANEMAWLEGKLVFNGTPLRDVAEELSRYVPGQIHVDDAVPDHPVTGIIQIRSTETMLDLLAQVVPITPVKQSASITVLHAIPM